MTAIQSPYSGGSSLATPVSVANGGTGAASVVAYTPVVGGTTATNPFQSVPTLSTNGQALISLGAGQIPQFGGALAPTTSALTDAAPTTMNADLGNYFIWLLTSAVGASRTLSAPTNATSGQLIYISIQQPASGGPCTVSWTSGINGFSFGASGAPTLSTTANTVDVIAFRYSILLVKWIYQGSQLGFS